MRVRLRAAIVAALGLLALVSTTPALAIGNILDAQQGRPDLDARTGNVDPTAAQTADRVEPRRDRDLESLRYAAVADQVRRLPRDGPRAPIRSPLPRRSSPNNKALFRLSDQGVANLQLAERLAARRQRGTRRCCSGRRSAAAVDAGRADHRRRRRRQGRVRLVLVGGGRRRTRWRDALAGCGVGRRCERRRPLGVGRQRPLREGRRNDGLDGPQGRAASASTSARG